VRIRSSPHYLFELLQRHFTVRRHAQLE